MAHFYEGCEMRTTNHIEGKNDRARFRAVECENYNDCRTEDRFFEYLYDEKKIYHTLITVACTNVTQVQPIMSESDVKKILKKYKSEETNEYLR